MVQMKDREYKGEIIHGENGLGESVVCRVRAHFKVSKWLFFEHFLTFVNNNHHWNKIKGVFLPQLEHKASTIFLHNGAKTFILASAGFGLVAILRLMMQPGHSAKGIILWLNG